MKIIDFLKKIFKKTNVNNTHLDTNLIKFSLILSKTIRSQLLKQTEFTLNIPLDYIKKYYTYKNPCPLTITVGKELCNDASEYINGNGKKEILLNYEYIKQNTTIGLASIIVSDLVYFVNDNENIITNNLYTVNDNDIYNLVYLLTPIECCKRFTEFALLLYYYGQNKIFPISFYEQITHINEIENIISIFRNNSDKQSKLKQTNGKSLKWYIKIFKKYTSKINNIYSEFSKEPNNSSSAK